MRIQLSSSISVNSAFRIFYHYSPDFGEKLLIIACLLLITANISIITNVKDVNIVHRGVR